MEKAGTILPMITAASAGTESLSTPMELVLTLGVKRGGKRERSERSGRLHACEHGK
jgi:hypothetical protein